MADINDDVRTVVLLGLGKVPVVGELISGLLGALWPETDDTWDTIRRNVEELVSQKISDLEYSLVKNDLGGLRNVIADYTTALRDSQSNPSYIASKYNVVLGQCEVLQTHFQGPGYEVLLLPLFAQFANLHLSLLRDGVTFGATWEWGAGVVHDEGVKLHNLINNYVGFSQTWYQRGYVQLSLPGDSTYRIENWRAQNRYIRQMTLNVLDHAHYWPSFDPQTNSGALSNLSRPTRTIYSDPIGTAVDTGIDIPTAPRAPITGMNIWAKDYVDAIRVAYGGEWGPRQGDPQPPPAWTVSNQPPNGWSGDIDPIDNPVVRVSGSSGQVLDSIQLWFSDGASTNLCGGLAQDPTDPSRPDIGGGYDVRFDGHVLSSVVIMGRSYYNGYANCMVLGFRLPTSYEAQWGPLASRTFVASKTLTWQMAGSNRHFKITFEATGTGVIGDPVGSTRGGLFTEIGNRPGTKFHWRATADGIEVKFDDGAWVNGPPVLFILNLVNGRYQLDGTKVEWKRTYSISNY
jgi:delta endotoxin-like protein